METNAGIITTEFGGGHPFPVPALAARGLFLFHEFPKVVIAYESLVSGVLVPVAFALVCDLRTREIPDWIPLVIFAWACLATAMGLHRVTWIGLIAGTMLGLGLSAAVCYLGGLGGGDVTLLAAIGAAVGPGTLLSILAWMALAGDILVP